MSPDEFESIRKLTTHRTSPLRATGSSNIPLLGLLLALALAMITFFAWSYYQDWKLKRAFRRRPGSSIPKSRSRLWNYYQDWKKKRDFRRTWNQKMPKRKA